MHHTISNIDKTIDLQQYIDNRDGNKRVGLKCISYCVGWYNVIGQYIQKSGSTSYKIPDGYYSFQQIADLFQSLNITLLVNESNGIVSLTTLEEVKISKRLKLLLGFDKRMFAGNETHISNRTADMAVIKSLNIHLLQINTSQNYLDGAPSTILSVVPIENKQFGDIISERFERPEYKCLMNGTISELKLEIRDENNDKINNHNLPINCVLEII